MPNGTLIQYGSAWVSNDDYTINVILPESFINSDYAAIAIPWTICTAFYVERDSNSQITIGRTPSSPGTGFDWIAIGRWK